jgi:hypothetical protein
MKLHQIIEVHEPPYFRKMRVEGGFLYNFYNCQADEYLAEWEFVPDPCKCGKLSNDIKKTCKL